MPFLLLNRQCHSTEQKLFSDLGNNYLSSNVVNFCVTSVTVGELRVSPWLVAPELGKLIIIIHNPAEHEQLGRGRGFGDSPANGAWLAADALWSTGLYECI